jgi:hypothetical protein
VLESTVSAPEEILLLLNHAEGHKLSKEELTQQAKNNTSTSLTVAFSRLLKSNEIRSTSTAGEVALTPKGQKRVIERIIPALKA